MLCRGSGPVQSRCGGSGLRDWFCSGCETWISAVPFDDDGAGIVPEHEKRLPFTATTEEAVRSLKDRGEWSEPEPAAPPDPEPAPEPVKKPKRPIDY